MKVTRTFCRAFSSDVVRRSETLTLLRDSHRDVFLVGTAHVSKESAEEVKYVIDTVQPDAIMLELDQGRSEELLKNRDGEQSDPLKKTIEALKSMGIAASFLEAFYESFRSVGIIPGAEFKAAMEEANRLDIPYVLGDIDKMLTFGSLRPHLNMKMLVQMMAKPPDVDREVLDTLGSIWGGGNVEKSVELMKDRKLVSKMVKMLRSFSPEISKVLIDVRDAHMVRALKGMDHKVIVGVVGMAHLDGMEKIWMEADK